MHKEWSAGLNQRRGNVRLAAVEMADHETFPVDAAPVL